MLGFFFFVLLLFFCIAYITLLERHLLGLSQDRVGPSNNFLFGLFQPVMDAIKLLQNIVVLTYSGYYLFYWFVPLFFFFCFFLQFPIFQTFFFPLSFDTNVIYIICVLGVGVFSHFFIGILSVSKYSSLGSLRSIIQSVSYEVLFFFVLLTIMFLNNSYCCLPNFFFYIFIFFLIFLILILSEVGRAPFDFTEGESELVSGFNLEYSSLIFIFLFLSEYGHLILFCTFISFLLLFWSPIYILPLPTFIFFFALLFRSSYPRLRFDYFISLYWFILLPFGIQLILFFYLFL